MGRSESQVTVVYVGVHDEVEVPDLGLVARRDEPVTVTAAQAEQLLASSVWQRAGRSRATSDEEQS